MENERRSYMKKVMKRVITACLAFAMILALVTPASVEAATKNESLTLYKGETYTWYLTGVKSLSSASSTKKAVATVKANKSKKQYTISAKKAFIICAHGVSGITMP